MQPPVPLTPISFPSVGFIPLADLPACFRGATPALTAPETPGDSCLMTNYTRRREPNAEGAGLWLVSNAAAAVISTPTCYRFLTFCHRFVGPRLYAAVAIYRLFPDIEISRGAIRIAARSKGSYAKILYLLRGYDKSYLSFSFPFSFSQV